MSGHKTDDFDTIDHPSDRYKRGIAILLQVGGANYDVPSVHSRISRLRSVASWSNLDMEMSSPALLLV